MKPLRLAVLGSLLVAGAPVAASADQVFGLHGGFFVARSLDGRSSSDCGSLSCRDVLAENLNFLIFDLKDFNGPTVGADWMMGIGDYFEAGVSTSFYQRTSPAVYANRVRPGGAEIEQDLKLRIVPVSALVKIYPTGRRSFVQPYVGAGVSYYAWRYSEAGEFVDFRDNSIFRDAFVDSGAKVGGMGLAGVRFATSDSVMFGGEFRYQAGRADLDPDKGFAADKLDLGGFSSLFTVQFRF